MHKLWALACQKPESLYLYLHNKGLTRRKVPGAHRTRSELALFREVVAPWREVVSLFSHYGSVVQHMGLGPHKGGWEWWIFSGRAARFLQVGLNRFSRRDVIITKIGWVKVLFTAMSA